MRKLLYFGPSTILDISVRRVQFMIAEERMVAGKLINEFNLVSKGIADQSVEAKQRMADLHYRLATLDGFQYFGVNVRTSLE